jgi:hypothetical protein
MGRRYFKQVEALFQAGGQRIRSRRVLCTDRESSLGHKEIPTNKMYGRLGIHSWENSQLSR